MLYTKIQPQSFLSIGEKDFQVFLPYMGMAAILFNDAEPFEQSVNIPLTEGPMWNLVKIGQVVSEKKTFKDFMVLYLYIAVKQVQITPGDKTMILSKTFYYFYHTL